MKYFCHAKRYNTFKMHGWRGKSKEGDGNIENDITGKITSRDSSLSVQLGKKIKSVGDTLKSTFNIW